MKEKITKEEELTETIHLLVFGIILITAISMILELGVIK